MKKFGNGNFWANRRRNNSRKTKLKLLKKWPNRVIPAELQCFLFYFLFRKERAELSMTTMEIDKYIEPT